MKQNQAAKKKDRWVWELLAISNPVSCRENNSRTIFLKGFCPWGRRSWEDVCLWAKMALDIFFLFFVLDHWWKIWSFERHAHTYWRQKQERTKYFLFHFKLLVALSKWSDSNPSRVSSDSCVMDSSHHFLKLALALESGVGLMRWGWAMGEVGINYYDPVGWPWTRVYIQILRKDF